MKVSAFNVCFSVPMWPLGSVPDSPSPLNIYLSLPVSAKFFTASQLLWEKPGHSFVDIATHQKMPSTWGTNHSQSTKKIQFWFSVFLYYLWPLEVHSGFFDTRIFFRTTLFIDRFQKPWGTGRLVCMSKPPFNFA